MTIDNIFIDKYKFTKYTVTPIYNWLSNHDVQLLTIKYRNLLGPLLLLLYINDLPKIVIDNAEVVLYADDY
jgi:hypothetical protein